MNTLLLNWYVKNVDYMNSFKRQLLGNLRSILPAVVAIAIGLTCADVFAAGGADAALTTVADNVKAVIILGLQLILAVVFLMVAWAIISKFNEARRGRADWGEVVVPFVVGAAVVILVAYLAGEGETAANALTGG